MTVLDWLQESKERSLENGWRGFQESLYEFHIGAARRLSMIYDPGRPIWDSDWDMLVVLDGARYDLMREVYREYDYIDKFGSFMSAASLSARWMAINFSSDYHSQMQRTVYVTGNPSSEQHIPDPSQFQYLDEVWAYAWDDDLGTIRPGPITDRVIALHREYNPKRIIVHYMQPHYPMVPEPVESDEKIWDLLRDGKIDREDVWRRYRDNLRYVLDELPTLLNNVNAEQTVITADHGNLIGELGLYGHFGKVPHPALRKVPWARTTAKDTGNYTPKIDASLQDASSSQAKNRLEDLGYI